MLTNGQVRKALQGSIRKWEKIVAGDGVDDGVNNCPLCKIFHFYDRFGDLPCAGCPVAISAGRRYCIGTPYTAWASEFPTCTWLKRADTDERRACAKNELAFLRGLDRKFFVEGVTVK